MADKAVKKQRRSFTPEYRREAAMLVIGTGRPIVVVAREIVAGEQLLGRWVGVERARMEVTPAGRLGAEERVELARLRREVAELRKDNEFLGNAAAFFASNQQ